jgi:hypothetical protein
MGKPAYDQLVEVCEKALASRSIAPHPASQPAEPDASPPRD